MVLPQVEKNVALHASITYVAALVSGNAQEDLRDIDFVGPEDRSKHILDEGLFGLPFDADLDPCHRAISAGAGGFF